jgi:hypothetical protein
MPDKFDIRWSDNATVYAVSSAVSGVFDAASGTIIWAQPDPILQKIESFGRLPPGWDYGRGGPIARDIRAEAEKWHAVLSGNSLEYINAIPGIDAVTLTGGRGAHRIEIIITRRNGALSYGFAHDIDRKQQFYRTKLSVSEMQSELTKVLGSMKTLGETWTAFTYYTRGNTMSWAKRFREMPSGTTGARSQSLTGPVPDAAQSALTSGASIASGLGSLATQPFSFDLTQPVYQLNAA